MNACCCKERRCWAGFSTSKWAAQRMASAHDTTSASIVVCFKQACMTADGHLACVCWFRPGWCKGVHGHARLRCCL